jgi:hypothetical protein
VTIPDSAILLSGSAGWTFDDMKALKEWFHEYLVWLRTSTNGMEEEKAANNHGSWYRAQVVAFALFTGETTLVEGILAKDVPQLIARQIEPDGKQPLELARTRSLHYSVFNLEALISLAVLGEHLGINVWDFSTSDGRSLKLALDFVIPYFNNGTWPYKEITSENESGFAYYLKKASIGYGNPAYFDTAEVILGTNTASDRSNLLCPK